MFKKLNNEQAFTLIELLFTLTVIALISALSAPFLISIYEKQTEKQFFTLLEQDVSRLQNSSFRNNDYNRIIFLDDHYVVIDNSFIENSITRHYPKHISLKYSNAVIKSFNERGTIVNPGTIAIRSKYVDKNIVFPFGKGRFYVEEH